MPTTPRDSSRWHVSPAIDVAGYAFSWVFVAIPVFLLLDAGRSSAFYAFLATTLIIDLHRHYTLPYVFLDGDVRRRYPVRFLLLPLVFLVLLTQTPALARSPRLVGPSEAGATLSWIWLTLQLLQQDRGGAFQWRTAVPLYLGSLAGATALTAAGLPTGETWMAVGIGASLFLHRLVTNDASTNPESGTRAHWLFPAGALAIGGGAILASPLTVGIPARAPTSLLALTFALWQTYHVLMQKYGILRIYSAKSGQPEKVPGWVDRLAVLGIVPPFLVWAGGTQLETLQANVSGDVGRVLLPPLTFLGDNFEALIALACAFAAVCLGLFVSHEWRIHRLRNAPRLWFAGGTLLLYASLFPLGLTGAYLVFACSHGIEYMVFIWAYQRRRYRDPTAHPSALSRLLRHPIAFYVSFTAAILGIMLYARFGTRLPALSSLPNTLWGETVLTWIFWYTLYQGILHFYYDGFLWKIRRPALRADL